MTMLCSKHSRPGDPPGGEILWSLLIPPGKTALILCERGHYVRVWSPVAPLFFPFITPRLAGAIA